MRIILDECVNAGVKAAFSGHAVKTVSETGWCGSKDRSLLSYAQEHFDVFVTIERKLERQQNLKKLRLGFVVSPRAEQRNISYRPIFVELERAARNVKAGEVIHVVHPQMRVA